MHDNAAAFTTIFCFLGGVAGIQLVSRILHHYIPSHIVDCDHSHDEAHGEEQDAHHHENGHAHKQNGHASESTPLLTCDDVDLKVGRESRFPSSAAVTAEHHNPPFSTASPLSRRPTFQKRLTHRVSTFVSGAKTSCDEGGPCHGYSEPCGQGCLKTCSRSPTTVAPRAFGRLSVSGPIRQPSLLRTTSTPPTRLSRSGDYDEEIGEFQPSHMGLQRPPTTRSAASAQAVFRGRSGRAPTQLMNEMRPPDETEEDSDNDDERDSSSTAHASETSQDGAHHHHVPSNAFMAIGVQTSIAIALHKLPEGFITYATNHANPKLGFTVFMALFIHNITEGFAMALPLYLAINSRWRAVFISSVLGGISQPLGAGIAALWFKIAGSGSAAPGDIVYGCMFSITAGIMASVALQLFSESLALNHSQGLCTVFAFTGMGILGISFALTA